MFGGRKTRKMAGHKARVYRPTGNPRQDAPCGMTERILRSYGVPPATAGNAVAVVTSGEEAFRRLVALIDGARETIHITTYILGRDPVGAEIVTRLAAKAADGIAVRLLLDDVGSWRVGRKFLAPLTAAGARVAFFMPMIHLPFRGRANLRNHRKILVVDGRRAIAGGMNLAEEYMGPAPDPKRWRDLAVTVEGSAARDLDDLFHSDWQLATGEDLPREDRPE